MAQPDLTIDLVVIKLAEVDHIEKFAQSIAAAVLVAFGHQFLRFPERQRRVLKDLDSIGDALVPAFADLHFQYIFLGFHKPFQYHPDM
jgi:hypothetical protein